MNRFWLGMLLLLLAGYLCAQEVRLNTIKVTAKRDEPLSSFSFQDTQTSKIILDDLYVAQSRSLIDRLKEEPGLDIGSPSSILMRGGKSSDTLIILDGIPLNDPTSPSRQFDFNNLVDGLLESAEIIQGSQTVLYGPNAVGGVLALKTKPALCQRHGQLGYTFGSAHLQKENLTGGYGDSQAGGLINIEHQRQGEGHIYNPVRKIRQSDDEHGGSMTGKGTLNLKQDIKITAYGSQLGHETKLNQYENSVFTESQNATLKKKTHLTYLKLELAILEKSNFHLTLSDLTSRAKSYAQGISTSDSGSRKRVSMGATKKFSHFGELTMGGDHETEFMENIQGGERLQEFKGLFLHHLLIPLKRLTLKTGIRLDGHQQWKRELSYTGSVSYQFPLILLFLNYGTGFRAPSLIELYGLNIGTLKQFPNTSLMPERSKSIDMGIMHVFPEKKIDLKLVFFYLRIDHTIRPRQLNGIDFIAENIHQRDSKGLEFSVKYKISSKWKLNASWTETSADDTEEGFKTQALRIPRHKGRVGIEHKLTPQVKFFSSFQYTGKMRDFGGMIKEYVDVTAGVLYQPTKRIMGFLRVENMLNQKEERFLGFASRGFSLYAGVQAKI